MTTIKRVGAGRYELADGGNVVDVFKGDVRLGKTRWMAAAQWDRHRVTDPVATKREAVNHGRNMLRAKGLQDGGLE